MKDIKFTENFGLNKKQIDLDFIDIYLNRDIPLFLDPWTFKKYSDDFGKKCNYKIISFFDNLIQTIKSGDKDKALELLNYLSEIKETRLGTGKKGYGGTGVSGKFSEKIFDAFYTSKAIKTGKIIDLEDTVLVIDDIGPDRISDMITNIISDLLVEYTIEQCKLYGIKTKEVHGYNYWDESKNEWGQLNKILLPYSDYFGKILLVPKWYVRMTKQYFSHSNFYQREILEFEQSNHQKVGSSLCKLLKNKNYQKPSKKILEEKYPISKKLVFEYIDKNPDLLITYKDRKNEQIKDLDIVEMQGETFNKESFFQDKIDHFNNIVSGKKDADVFHNHIMDCLNNTFQPSLRYPKKEAQMHSGRKRIDIEYNNASEKGFFNNLSKYDIACADIYFECKNYSTDLKNPEFDQLLGRFNTRSSTIGFIVCRTIYNEEKIIEHCKDYVRDQNRYIIVLEDKDIIKMLQFKMKGEDCEIDKYLKIKLDKILKK